MVSEKMEKKNMVDVSCFFLFEASGDSEGGLDPLLPELGCSVSPDMDAESCCDEDVDDSETGYGGDGGEERGEFEERESEEEMISHCQRWCEEEEEEEEEEEDAEKKPRTKSSASGCLKRDKEFLNEMEKNRLFWEACLAS